MYLCFFHLTKGRSKKKENYSINWGKWKWSWNRWYLLLCCMPCYSLAGSI